MGLLFADSFSWYVTAQRLRYYASGTSSGVDVGPYGASGGPGMRFTDQATNIFATVTPVDATCVIGFDFKVSALPAAVNILATIQESATVHVGIALNTNNEIAVYRGDTTGTLLGTSSYVVPLNKRIHINAKVTIDNSTGSVIVRVTEDVVTTEVLTLTGVDTRNGGSGVYNSIGLSGTAGSGFTDIENLVIQDTSGASSTLNDFLGPVDVVALAPNGVGTNQQWDRSSLVDRYRNVDEAVANDDITYNYALSSSITDTHEMEDSPNPNQQPIGVVLINVARREGSGSVTLAPVIRQGSTDTAGSAASLTTSYMAYPQPYNTLPDGAPWSTDEWNNLELGYRRAA